MWLFLLSILLLSPAEAKQTQHQIRKDSATWTFTQRWTDSENKKHSVQFSLPSKSIVQDLKAPLQYPEQHAAQYIAKEVRKWGKKNNYSVKAKAINGRVNIQVSAQISDIRKIMRAAKKVRDDAYERYFERQGYTQIRMPFRLRKGVMPNHMEHVKSYATELSPLVVALGGPTKDPRDFANKALSYVQNIPYEQRSLVSDRYRRPLSLIGKNQGDCDSKSVLFLALMHSAYPDMDLGMVYIRGHAFAALGLKPTIGQRSLFHKWQRWILVEPVGPALEPIGKISPKSLLLSKLQLYRMRTL